MTTFGATISSTEVSIPRVIATGPPTTGTHALYDSYIDGTGQAWVCTVAGTPGTWVAVGSGRAIGGPTFLGTNFTMATAATEEDVTGLSVTFTYDGRPVRILCHCPYVFQDQAALKAITMKLARSTDTAIQVAGTNTPPAVANVSVPIIMDTGPITAWPSDSAAFVVGTSYTFKARITSGAASKATVAGGLVAGSRAHITAYSC